MTFELREELPVLGDMLVASSAVPVDNLTAAGGGQASYQLATLDGKHPNRVITFSYAFHGNAVTSPPTEETAPSGPYQGIHWLSTEQVVVYPTIAVVAERHHFQCTHHSCRMQHAESQQQSQLLFTRRCQRAASTFLSVWQLSQRPSEGHREVLEDQGRRCG